MSHMYEDLDLTVEQKEIAQKYLELSPTDQLLEALDRAQRVLDEIPDWPANEQRRKWSTESVLRCQADLEHGIERDALQATRRSDCWCLGVGGKTVISERVGEQRWRFFRNHCFCDDGRRQLIRDNTQRNAYQTAADQVRANKFRHTLPARFNGLTLESFPTGTAEQKTVLERIAFFLEGQWADDMEVDAIRQWLLLHGPYGTGKTGLAGAIGFELLRTGFVNSVHMHAVPRLLDRVRATYNRHDKSEETEADVMEELFDVECLILDDLGAERATDWAVERLFTLINHRHDEELMTIITTNLHPSELGAHIGERTMWRIAELSYVVSLEGCPNLRLPGTNTGKDTNVVPLKQGAA